MKQTLIIGFALLLLQYGSAQTWTPLYVGTSASIVDISFPSNDTGFAALDNGTIRKTVDGGANWNVVPSPNSFYGPIVFNSNSRGFILTDSGITSTNNCGLSWSVAFDDANVNSWQDIFFLNKDTGFAAGVNLNSDTFHIFKTVDGGVNWIPCTPIQYGFAQINFIYFRTALEGYLSGTDQVYRTSDGGVTWINVYTSVSGPVSTLSAPDPSTAYCSDVATFDVIKSTNGGIAWNPTGQTLSSPPYSSHFINSTFGFICGGNGITSGYIAQTTNGGSSWTNAYSGGATMQCMDFPSATTGYCGGTGGLIMKYADPMNVESQNILTPEIYPNPATDILTLVNLKPNSQITIINSLGEIVIAQTAIDNRMQIDVSVLAEGVYSCQITSEGTRSVEQVIIQK